MIKFRLSRKRKKQYKKDLCCNRGPLSSLYSKKEYWEWFYFKRRVEIRCIQCILNYPLYNRETNTYEFDINLVKPATKEELLSWYKKRYPNDKEAQSYCLQNLNPWGKYNQKS